MKSLQINNPHFITYKDTLLTLDILGGVDIKQVERMVCTLRISYQQYPPYRTTIDLYNDTQTDKLLRILCDKWELKLIDVSKTIHQMTLDLETYRLEQLRYIGKAKQQYFQLATDAKKQAVKLLKSKNLAQNIVQYLNTTGIIGEDENALILFLTLASYKYGHPFSTICLAKSGIGKSYILQKLRECMPMGAYSFHTQISANALYYFNSQDIQNKALLIEDLEWTTQMLSPLATLQTQSKLVKTRATKDKDGMLHSTTFEVNAKLCLLACAYSDKNYENMSLPFLMVHLNHSQAQDLAIMDYQRRTAAGLIKTEHIQQAQRTLQNMIASLDTVSVVNPYATLIELPKEVAHPRKSLLVLLNFIEVITYFFQYQRTQIVDKDTGEVFVQTHPNDIALAFKLLKNSLFRKADELSTTARGFYKWLTNFLTEAKTNQFTALDIRKAKAIHPRTLNRYLQELKLYAYIQVVGGNKHRGGYLYKITQLGSQTQVQTRIEQALARTLTTIQEKHKSNNNSKTSKTVSQKPLSNSKKQTTQANNSRTTPKNKN